MAFSSTTVKNIKNIEWRIENFSKNQQQYEASDFLSFAFEESKFSFSAYFMPNATRKHSQIIIRMLRENYTDFEIITTVRIKNFQVLIEMKPNEIRKCYDFINCSKMMSKKNYLLTGNDLVLNFEFKVISLPAQFFQMMMMSEFSDLIFVSSDNIEFRVHREIIEAQSFKLKLMVAKKERVHFNNVRGEILNELIRFIYTKKVENFVDISLDLLILTSELEIYDFKKLYINRIISQSINLVNVTRFLIFAADDNDDRLRTACCEIIYRNYVANGQNAAENYQRAVHMLLDFYYYDNQSFRGLRHSLFEEDDVFFPFAF